MMDLKTAIIQAEKELQRHQNITFNKAAEKRIKKVIAGLRQEKHGYTPADIMAVANAYGVANRWGPWANALSEYIKWEKNREKENWACDDKEKETGKPEIDYVGDCGKSIDNADLKPVIEVGNMAKMSVPEKPPHIHLSTLQFYYGKPCTLGINYLYGFDRRHNEEKLATNMGAHFRVILIKDNKKAMGPTQSYGIRGNFIIQNTKGAIGNRFTKEERYSGKWILPGTPKKGLGTYPATLGKYQLFFFIDDYLVDIVQFEIKANPKNRMMYANSIGWKLDNGNG